MFFFNLFLFLVTGKNVENQLENVHCQIFTRMCKTYKKSVDLNKIFGIYSLITEVI